MEVRVAIGNETVVTIIASGEEDMPHEVEVDVEYLEKGYFVDEDEVE